MQTGSITRRKFVERSALAAGFSIAGCRRRSSANRAVKIGFVSPRTGEMAAFGEADAFVLRGIRGALAGGLTIAGINHPVEIDEKDSRSDSNRAAEVAAELIKRDNVDLLLTADTPETVNPVADQAEINEVPCITTDAPWQPCFFGRGGTVAEPFDWTYHFFWGLDDLMNVYVDLWDSLPTNKLVGFLWANDTNGMIMADPANGFPPLLKARGFQYIDPGRFEGESREFSAQIGIFKQAGVEIVTGGLPTSGFAAFWNQAAQQGFNPRIVTIAKALLFPADVASLGRRAANLTSEIWWSAHHPFRSSVTGQTAEQLCMDYERETRRQWTPIIGFKHALFSVGIDVLKRTQNIDSPQSVAEAIRATDYDSIVGPISWRNGPVKNVSKTPLVGGQWVPGAKHPFDLVVVNNQGFPRIPVEAQMKPIE
jgi:branched-chain amino acid transport system substrate-binding protein